MYLLYYLLVLVILVNIFSKTILLLLITLPGDNVYNVCDVMCNNVWPCYEYEYGQAVKSRAEIFFMFMDIFSEHSL